MTSLSFLQLFQVWVASMAATYVYNLLGLKGPKVNVSVEFIEETADEGI